MKISFFVISLLLLACLLAPANAPAGPGKASARETDLQAFVDAIKAEGADPVEFVLGSLDGHDLIIFDDALHYAVEPFEFYINLVRTPAFREQVKYVFLELAPVNHQPCLDAYFAAPEEDRSLVYPVFQDIADMGMPYATYFDLLSAIYQVNSKLPEDERIRVVAVSQPTFWPQVKTRRDVEIYRQNHLYRDYLMYRYILMELDEFRSGRKGMFLTNTRHAYNSIRKKDGAYFWNTATFFRQWHPCKTLSIRFHNVSLHFASRKEAGDQNGGTPEGAGDIDIQWVRMGEGIWDCAFAENGNRPVALPLAGNPFGLHPYIGNHMLNAKPGQTMADAYDAVIFLAPLETLRKSARLGNIYTPEFKRELARRIRVIHTPEQLAERLSDSGVQTVEALVDVIAEPEPARHLPQAAAAGSRDAWRDRP